MVEARSRHRARTPPGARPSALHVALARALALVLVGALVALPALAAPAAASPVVVEPEVARPRLLLLVGPDAAPVLTSQIHRVLVDTLGELPAEVIIALDDRPSAPLPERILVGAAAARRTGSIAAVWLDIDGDDLVLCFLDPRTEAAQLRRIHGGEGPDATNLEAAALIARDSLASRLRGPPEARPPPPIPEHPPPPPRPRRARLLIAYHGDLYADPIYVAADRRWQSAVDLQVAYLWESGAYVGASGLASGPLTLRTIQLGSGDLLDTKIQRVPLAAVAGYHRLFGRFGLEAEFAVGVEIVWARASLCGPVTASSSCPPSAVALADPTPIVRRPPVGFAPRFRALYSPVTDFFLFVGGGLDLFTDATLYYQCTECAKKTLFHARNFRPVAQIGLLLRL